MIADEKYLLGICKLYCVILQNERVYIVFVILLTVLLL